MECCGCCFPRTKKSFKTSSIPEPPSHTKSAQPSNNRAPPSNGSTTQYNGAPPSPSNSHTSSHSGGEAPRNGGQRTLEITLPAGNAVTATVDAKLQMMDLLVMIASKNKLKPTGHVVIPATADRTDISQFKASQCIGELDTTKLQIVPKLSRGEIISIRTSDKKKAAQFEQTVRLTVLSGKNHKALFRVNPEKPIQDFLPQVYEERGIEANECRLRLVKSPEEDIDYSQSLNHYGGVNELVLIDLRPPPPEPEVVLIEKKKKSMFGRKSKKKGEGEPLQVSPVKDSPVKEAAPPEVSHAPPVAAPVRQPSADSIESSENGTLKKRRPAPPPPPGGKKEPTHDGQLLKPSFEGVSRSAAQGVSKKRRAPAPPPVGGAPVPPLTDSAPEVTVHDGGEPTALSDQDRHITFGTTEVIESGSETAMAPSPLATPLDTPNYTPPDTPTDTPTSTLERKKDDGGDAAVSDDIQVEFSLADLDEVLDEDIPPPPDYAPPPPPVFDPPPPPEDPPSPGEPQEDVERLIQEGRLVMSPGGGGIEGNDTASECSSDLDLASSLTASATTSSLIQSMEDAFEEALAVGRESLTNDVAAEQEVTVSEVNVSEVNASIDQSTPEDPESGEKVQVDPASTNEDGDTIEADATEMQTDQSEHTTEDGTAALSLPPLLTPNNKLGTSEGGLTNTSQLQKIELTRTSSDGSTTKPMPKPRIGKVLNSSCESQSDAARDRSSSDANRNQTAPVPKPRISRFASEPKLGTPKKESADAPKKFIKQKSVDQISGRYKKRKAPRRPPPISPSIDQDEEASLSALQSAFLEAFSRQHVSKTATAPVMKLRPSRPPPLPPTFRKDRSASTNDIKSIKSVQFAGDLKKQPPVTQRAKSFDDPLVKSRPVVPARRKKKKSSDSLSDQHSLPDQVMGETVEVLPTPAIRTRKPLKKQENTSVNQNGNKAATMPASSRENPNRIQVEVEIAAPPRHAHEEVKGATASKPTIENPEEVDSPNLLATMQESHPVLKNSLSGELEDTLKSRLILLHKSMRLEDSFDTINSNDDVFLDETFGDPPSEPDARSSEKLTTSLDSTDTPRQDSFNREERGGSISVDLKEKGTEEEIVGELSSGFESECVSTEAVVVETIPNIASSSVIPKTKDTTDITEKRAAMTKMMKLSLDEDSKETTSYSPTPQGEETESMLEEKSLSALVGGVTREAVDDQQQKETEDKVKDKVKDTEDAVEESAGVEEEKEVEGKKDDAMQEVGKPDEIAKDKVEQPNMEQLTEQYKQLQQQMALLQQQLALKPTSTSAAPMPAMAYQTQQMQQMQQQIMLQQMLMQQQQTMGGYVMMPQPGGGMMMSPQQMMYTPMGMQPMPVYGQATPPQAASTPAVDQQDSAGDTKSAVDEADGEIKEESKDTSGDQSNEVTPDETPVKSQSDAPTAPSGRRNVFADILKKKNAPKSSYVLSAQREAERQRSDSNSSLTSSSSKEGSTTLSVETPKLELRTETSPSTPPRTDSLVTNGLSPTSSEPSVSSPTGETPSSPSIPVSLSNNSSPNESNNNTSKTITLNAETTKPDVSTVEPTSPTPVIIGSQGSKKAPPAIRPKPQKGPRPFRPASMYARTPVAPETQEGASSSHARKVTDLRSMFMLGK